MFETNTDIAVAFYKAIIEGRVEDAFRLYAGGPYRQHNPLIEAGIASQTTNLVELMVSPD